MDSKRLLRAGSGSASRAGSVGVPVVCFVKKKTHRSRTGPDRSAHDSQTLHVCHICLHWGALRGQCRQIWHTWSVWDWYVDVRRVSDQLQYNEVDARYHTRYPKVRDARWFTGCRWRRFTTWQRLRGNDSVFMNQDTGCHAEGRLTVGIQHLAHLAPFRE